MQLLCGFANAVLPRTGLWWQPAGGRRDTGPGPCKVPDCRGAWCCANHTRTERLSLPLPTRCLAAQRRHPLTAPGAEIRGSAGRLSSPFRLLLTAGTRPGTESGRDAPSPGLAAPLRGGRRGGSGGGAGCGSPLPRRGRPELAAAAGHGADRDGEDQTVRRPETRYQRAAQAGEGLPEQCPVHRELHPKHPGHRAAGRAARGHAGGGGGRPLLHEGRHPAHRPHRRRQRGRAPARRAGGRWAALPDTRLHLWARKRYRPGAEAGPAPRGSAGSAALRGERGGPAGGASWQRLQEIAGALRVRGVDVNRRMTHELMRLRVRAARVSRSKNYLVVSPLFDTCRRDQTSAGAEVGKWVQLSCYCFFLLLGDSCVFQLTAQTSGTTRWWWGALGGEQCFIPQHWTASCCCRLHRCWFVLLLSFGQPKRSPAGNVGRDSCAEAEFANGGFSLRLIFSKWKTSPSPGTPDCSLSAANFLLHRPTRREWAEDA